VYFYGRNLKQADVIGEFLEDARNDIYSVFFLKPGYLLAICLL